MRASAPRSATASSTLLTWEWVLDLFASTRNAWLATTAPTGAPHVAPLWTVVVDGAIWFWTPSTSAKGRNLARDGHMALHVESGDDVAIVSGRAAAVTAPVAVRDAYVRKYESRLDDDSFWRVEVDAARAWRGHLGTEQVNATRFAP